MRSSTSTRDQSLAAGWSGFIETGLSIGSGHNAIGSAPCHYVLDSLGAKIVAADRGIRVHALGWRKEDVEAWPYRRDLWHLVDTNGFFTRHVWACRQRGEYRLTEWWSERRTADRWESIVQPDGYGRLDSPFGARSFFLELDRASEGSARLRGKLEGFRRLSAMGNRPDAVLFVVPDSKREVFVRPHLDSAGMTIATTTWDQVQSDPLGSIWLPISSERRRRLLELPVAR